MIPVEAHLALNHVPLIGLVFGLVFLLAGLSRSSEQAVRAGLRIFLAMGIAVFPVVGSGLVSATILANASWLDASALNSHRLAGILTIFVVGALATLSGVRLFVSRRNGLPMSGRARNAVLILAIAGVATNLWTAFLGGALRHTELASGRARASTQGVVTTDRGTTSSVFALQPRVRHRTANDSGGRHGMRNDGGDDDRDHRTDCHAYAAFNQRDIDRALSAMHSDVEWENGMEGGFVRGHDAVRSYWTRQWQVLDPRVEPIALTEDETGRIIVTVHQIVRDRAGTLFVDQHVRHVYSLRNGLVCRMEIASATARRE